MTYSKEEIDKAISELKNMDLYIARMTSRALCTMEYNMYSNFLKGDERKSYQELWSKKLKAAREELKTAKTIQSVFDIIDKFDSELVKYLKAEKVKTATEAMDIAHTFIKKYVPVALPMKAVKEKDVWLVDVDVGALAVKVAKVKVDARTGDILSYEIPEK